MFGLIPRREKERAEYPLTNLRHEFKTLYDRLFNTWPVPVEALFPHERFWGLELEEAEKEMIVRAEVPGFAPEEVEVELLGNELMIRAVKKLPPTEKDKVPPERRYERLVTLPVDTIPEKVEAAYHNGILEVHLPRTEAVVPKRIPVKVT
jgi:HSP20 family protein